MTGTSVPRVVEVTRPTEYAALLVRHGTREQARFFLGARGRSIDDVEARDQALRAASAQVAAAIPSDWRRARVSRSDLDRFLFEPGDIICTIGPSGLVANVAKYLRGQPVIGFDPDQGRDGAVLASHHPDEASVLVPAVAAGQAPVRERTMVEAVLDDGQRVLALNEVFVGHASHQSARYVLRGTGTAERQSSSGVVVTTGTGATGWGRSIGLGRRTTLPMPAPDEPALAWFVREAWPAPAFGTSQTEGRVVAGETLEITSELDEGGVIFGDGIESDAVAFGWGTVARVRVAAERLRLVEAG